MIVCSRPATKLAYNRGQSKSQLPPGVGQVVFDRPEPGQLREALKTHKPDAVVDTIAFKIDEVEEELIFAAYEG